jgi:hypothetical protein
MINNVMHSIRRLRGIFLSVALLVLLVSCTNDDEDFVTEPLEVSYVSIYHASPDAPAFDIILDGRVINREPFEYSSYSGYLNFFTGDRNIQFHSINADNALIDTTFNFVAGSAYSLFAVDKLSGGIEALLVVDSAASPAQGKAMVRFIHLSPDSEAFNIAVRGVSGDPLFEGKSFRQSTAFREIDASIYTFNINKADSPEVVLSAEDIEIRPGGFYTILVRGFVNPPQGNTNALSVEVLE